MSARGLLAVIGLLAGTMLIAITTPASAQGPAAKPNILVIFGDDIGQTNVSAYSMA